MEIKSINAKLLSKMFLTGAMNLDSKKDWINELNVFPVPDGDTGTNMSMTIMSAAKEVKELEAPEMEQLAKAISSGSLRGARGNSGVILSQLFRGFCKVIKTHDKLTVNILAEASQKAVETAYKAVMKPKEGTILTVAKGAADKANALAGTTNDVVYFLEQVIEEAEYVLSQTPEMLPVLKQAGVVDSGGQGLVQVLKGAYDALVGKEVDYANETEVASEELQFLYCTEAIVALNQPLSSKKENALKIYLESVGEDIVVVANDDHVKVHVHTNEPGLVLCECLKIGTLKNVKVNNRSENNGNCKDLTVEEVTTTNEEAAPAVEMPHKEMGFISVSVGEGINEIFRGLGVDYIIEGGQTMNPSTEDMLNAIAQVNADHIFILPNNKNIVMAANQAADLTEDKDIIVIPTKTVPQGITALVNFIPDYSAEENKETMCAEIENVKTGQVTYAVRDTEIDGKTIKQDDYMGIGDKSILAVGTDMKETTLEMVKEMVDEDSAIISIYAGADITDETAEDLVNTLTETYPDVEVELNCGGQPIYYYIISVE